MRHSLPEIDCLQEGLQWLVHEKYLILLALLLVGNYNYSESQCLISNSLYTLRTRVVASQSQIPTLPYISPSMPSKHKNYVFRQRQLNMFYWHLLLILSYLPTSLPRNKGGRLKRRDYMQKSLFICCFIYACWLWSIAELLWKYILSLTQHCPM